ncbi:MAG: amino acid permease [Pseudomonadales bacterium]|nr:amino acid permease [Pseudomonadales bacterium]
MTRLKRAISMPMLLFFGLGNILGAGIYVLIGKVAAESAIYAPVAFLCASLVAGFSAFTYAELSSRYPHSAGEAVYIQQGFGQTWISRIVGLLIALAGMVSAATVSRGFHGYFSVFLSLDAALVISGIVLLLGGLTVWGVRQSVGAAALLTIFEIVGLAVVIWAGRDLLASVPMRMPELLPPANLSVWTGIGLGAFIAFFAFIGFEDMVNVAEEVKNPARNLPLAILLALIIATVMYALVSIVAVLALPLAQLSTSTAPLTDVLAQLANYDARYISAISMLAIVNGALIQMVMASRLLYGMACKGWLPDALSRVNAKTRTPVNATLLVVAIILALALWLPVQTLAIATSYIVLIVFSMVNAALLALRLREGRATEGWSVPIWVPLFGLLSSAALIVFELVQRWAA